jgi:hypothetical protein
LEGARFLGARGAAAGITVSVDMLITARNIVLMLHCLHSAVKRARTVRHGNRELSYNQATRSG